MAAKPETIDAYLATVSADRRVALGKLRKTILSILPDAEECIGYSMPAFRYAGHVVAGFLATSKGCSYFPFNGTTLATMAVDAQAYDQTKSALHFDPTQPLPIALVRKLLKTRIAHEVRAPNCARQLRLLPRKLQALGELRGDIPSVRQLEAGGSLLRIVDGVQSGSGGRARTCNPSVNSRLLCH